MQAGPRPSLYSQLPMSLFGFKTVTGTRGQSWIFGTGEMAQPFGSQHPPQVAPNNLYLQFQGSWCPLLASSQTWYTDTRTHIHTIKNNNNKIKSF